MKIAMVGGGASAVVLLAHLLEQADTSDLKGLEVVIYEKNKTIGPGLAYSADLTRQGTYSK